MTISDIISDIYKKTKTNSTSYPAADMLIDINSAANRVHSKILINDSRWQLEDTNNTDLPIATTALVSGQQDYSLSAAHLTIDRVELKDSAGNWTELTQIDQQSLKSANAVALAAYRSTTGVPIEYDLSGNSVFLYPIPNYSQAASLKIYYTRGPAEFTSGEVTTGTKQPGFNSLFHKLIPLWVSYDYCLTNIPNLAAGYFAEIQLLEKSIEEFYGLRNRDMRGRLSASRESNR